jgi:hypothetical protein
LFKDLAGDLLAEKVLYGFPMGLAWAGNYYAALIES